MLITGGATTLMDAEAVLPVPPLVEVTVLLVFVKYPGLTAVTVTLMVQLPPPAIVPPENTS